MELPDTFNRFMVTVHQGRLVVGTAGLTMEPEAAVNLMAWLAVCLIMVDTDGEVSGVFASPDEELAVVLARVRALAEKIWAT